MLPHVLPEFCLFMSENILGVENCVLLFCHAASSDNLLPTFRYSALFPYSMLKVPFEDGTDKSSRNVGSTLPLLAG